MPSRWWRFGQQAERPAEAWEERVEADVAASAPKAMVQAGDGPLVPVTGASIEISRSESVREYLLRTPHEFDLDLPAYGGSAIRVCACGMWPGAVIHHGETLMDTRGYLDGIRREMESGPREGPAEALPDWEREFLEEEAAGVPEVKVPEPLPDGVLGYSVATRRSLSGGGWLTSADIMTREAAEHVLSVTGGTLVEVRVVTPCE